MNHIELKVNGIRIARDVKDNVRLIDFLREELKLTCTVIMDGKSVCSCLLLAAQCNGAEVTTVEALHHDPVGKKLQNAFIRHGGVQCGFCTPGVLMSAKALLDANPAPSDDELKEALEGNICRCTGYQPIITSIKAVLKS